MGRAHIGTMGWSYRFWTGNLYPEDHKPDEFLSDYSRHFDTVEVDSTFYRIPNKDTIMKWHDQTPPEFIFSAKFPRAITHEKMLRNCERELTRFLDSVSLLKSKIGPLLMQFPPWFGPDNLLVLDEFLTGLPEEHRFVVEMRNREILNDKLYSVLKDNGVALAIVDPFMVTNKEVTSDFIYIRWEGNRREVKGILGKVEVDRKSEIEKWAENITMFLDTSVEVFGYFSKYYSGYPPNDAKQLLRYILN